jgi:hypothetical protein
MAAHTPSHKSILELGVHEEDHPVWTAAFSDENRLRQLNEDLLAGRSVSAVLVMIVTAGLLLAVVSVFVLA